MSLYSYPAGLCAEEESFIRRTVETGDMSTFERSRESWGGGRGIFILAEEDGEKTVGCVGIREIEGGNCEIGRLTVGEESRGKGIANRLLHAGERWAKSKGFGSIYATTVGLNSAAVKCYEKNGYRESFWGRKDGKVGEPDFVTFMKEL